MFGSKHTLGGPIKHRNLNSSSIIAVTKRTLMHKCMTFSILRLFCCLLMSEWTASTRYHITLANKISSDRTSKYIDGPMPSMHSSFAGNLNLSQVKASGTQIHFIHYYIAEFYTVLLHRWGVYAILLLC